VGDRLAEPRLDPQLVQRRERLGAGRFEERGRTRSSASTRMIRAEVGSIRSNSRPIAWWAISAIEPASSTPVGPPPTTMKVSSARRRSGSSVFSASSKAWRIRLLMSSASSSVLSPGANGSHWSLPK
jgi:hypothetical protein